MSTSINIAVVNYSKIEGKYLRLSSVAVNGQTYRGKDAKGWFERIGQLVKAGELVKDKDTGYSRVYRPAPAQQPPRRRKPISEWNFVWVLTPWKTFEGRAGKQHADSKVLATRHRIKSGPSAGKMYHKTISFESVTKPLDGEFHKLGIIEKGRFVLS